MLLKLMTAAARSGGPGLVGSQTGESRTEAHERIQLYVEYIYVSANPRNLGQKLLCSGVSGTARLRGGDQTMQGPSHN